MPLVSGIRIGSFLTVIFPRDCVFFCFYRFYQVFTKNNLFLKQKLLLFDKTISNDIARIVNLSEMEENLSELCTKHLPKCLQDRDRIIFTQITEIRPNIRFIAVILVSGQYYEVWDKEIFRECSLEGNAGSFLGTITSIFSRILGTYLS